MPRPKTDKQWEERIRVIAANNPKASAKWVWEKLKREALGRSEAKRLPSDRTVGRILKEFRKLEASEQQPYLSFSWPESVQSGAFPWEAGSTALELLRFRNENRWGRPTNEMVQWFYRVTLAASDAPLAERWDAAMCLFMGQRAVERDEINRRVEGLLMFAPWRSKKNENEYIAATRRKENPIPSYVALPPELRKARPLRVKVQGPSWYKALMQDQLQAERKRGGKGR